MSAPVSLRLLDTAKHEEFYGFVHPPFAAASDPRFFVPAGSPGRSMEALLQAVRRGERLMVLTGGAGAGKTTLCRALVARVDEAVLTSLVLEPVRSIDELLRTVLQDFGVISSEGLRSGRVAAATRQELADALAGFLRSLEPIGGRCLVVVDQAHRLPAEVLEQLGQMTAEGAPQAGRLQIVLAGGTELLDVLREPGPARLDERISTRTALEPLTADEVREYIAGRLVTAGGSGAPSFEPAAAEAVYRHTQGVPAAIDAVCDRALSLGAQLEVRVIVPQVIDEAARTLGIADASIQTHEASSVRPWLKIGLPILLLLALIAAWFSGAVSALFP